jgi:ABC-2 type transport system permease protein
MTSSVLAVWRRREILNLLVRRDLAVKYQQSVLGYFWSLIEPLTIAATYWFIFGVLYGEDVGPGGVPYVLFLASGLFPWIWASGVLTEATTALTSQARLITTIKVPREIFAIGRVAAKFFEFLAALPVLFLVAFLTGGKFTWHLLYLPAAVLVQFVMMTGIALLLASANVMLRDVEKFTRLINRVLFYGLPIIYPLTRVLEANLPAWVAFVYQLNPLVGVMELYHSVWSQQHPAALPLWSALVGAVLALVTGWWAFRKLEPAVLKEL